MSETQKPRLYQVNAFTDERFGGNPAAVCILSEEQWHTVTSEWMQNVARDMCVSATGFASQIEENKFHLRWFTPECEVFLCGHATMGVSWILFHMGYATASTIAYETATSGTVYATKDEEGWIELNFPMMELSPEEDQVISDTLAKGLHSRPLEIFRAKPTNDLLVLFETEEIVKSLAPDPLVLCDVECRGVICTAPCDLTFDFVSRFFAPGVGISEDPVCGSAHCALTPYWSKKLNKTQMLAHQVSSRGGVLVITNKGDRVSLKGKGRLCFSGELEM